VGFGDDDLEFDRAVIGEHVGHEHLLETRRA